MGFECAKNLVLSSPTYHVILGSRSLTNSDTAVSNIRALSDCKGTVSTIQHDVCLESSVTAAVDYVTSTHGRLEILVNNTGIGERKREDPPHVRLRDCMETNTIGPVLVTESFLPLLRKSRHPRLVFVSSSAGSLSQNADPNSLYYAPKFGVRFSNYRASKAALNMLIIEYHKLLKEDGFIVDGADPGLVVTKFMDEEFEILRCA